MKVTTKKEIVVRLELNYHEADWLRAVMQNYQGAEEESSSDMDMRRMFFESINSALRKED